MRSTLGSTRAWLLLLLLVVASTTIRTATSFSSSSPLLLVLSSSSSRANWPQTLSARTNTKKRNKPSNIAPAAAKLYTRASVSTIQPVAATPPQEEEQDNSNSNNPHTGGGSATLSNEILNLVKGIVGAGVLTLPSGIATMGSTPSTVLPALLYIALFGTLSGYGFSLIGRVCAFTGTSSYRGAWETSLSKESSWIPAVSVTLKTLFAILAYSMILGDTFQSLACSAGLQCSKTMALVGLTTLVLLPLCLLKNLSSLAPFSLLGSLGMLYTAVAMSIRYGSRVYSKGGKFYMAKSPLAPSFGTTEGGTLWNPSTAILLGMLSTAYMAHFNAPKFYTELKNNTIKRFNIVVGTSFGISIAIYAWIAAVGFLTFGGASSGLILNNYSVNDSLMAVSRIAVAIALVFSYPLAFVGARDGVLDLFNIKDRSAKTLNALTVGILSAVTVAALNIPDVSFVLAFAGATLGNCLIYVFPGAMFRGAIRKLPNPSKRQLREVKVALTSAAIGTGLGIMGAIKAVQSIL